MITKADAKSAAEKGLIEAIKCSIEHHKDPRRLSSLELQNVYRENKFHLGPGLCALCCSFRWLPSACDGCPLGPKACCEEHSSANKAFGLFTNNPSNANHTAFLEAEEKMVLRLQIELEKALLNEMAKQDKIMRESAKSKAEEVTYSEGDRFRNEEGDKCLLVYTGNAFLVGLENGHYYHSKERISRPTRITPSEFAKICDGDTFTRYWDARKKERV